MSIIPFHEALQFDRERVKENHKTYLNLALVRLISMLKFDKQFVRAKGVQVWDSEGNEYLDFLGGYGALTLGHNPPEVIEALIAAYQAELPNLLQIALGAMPAALAETLAAIMPGNLTRSFFCNSGAEAVEGALKIARIATGKSVVISTEGAFHGKTFGALSASGREKYKKPFTPLLPGFEQIAYGDAAALEARLRRKEAAAFIVEPIQGEGGVIVPPPGYLRAVREICTRYGALLILDEVQTGFARTGRMFACMWEDVAPDVMSLSKSLGGSMAPIGAYICTEEVWTRAYGSTEKCALHTSTFGGNAYACAAALAAINSIVDQDLASQACKKGEYLMEKLQTIGQKHGLIKEVRGRGLMLGIEFNQPGGLVGRLAGGLTHEYLAAMVAGILQNEHHIITAYTLNNPNVIRIQPPLVVTYEQLDRFVDALDDVFTDNKNLMDIALKSARTALS